MNPFHDLIETYKSNSAEPTKNDVIDSPAFHVGIVTLAAGQEILPHPEPYTVFFYVLEGAGTFTGGDETIELAEGDGLYLDHGERRGIRCSEPLTILGIQGAH
ncbi:MAG: cupin domain-containing protein [archaeon]